MISESSNGSFRTSEIKELIREAVDDAIQPLMEMLEDREKLLTPSEKRILEEPGHDVASTESQV